MELYAKSSFTLAEREFNVKLSQLPGAHREKDVPVNDEGHGAAILSFKSQVKLKPVELSYTRSAG